MRNMPTTVRPKTEHDARLVDPELDALLVERIATLWSKGYRTTSAIYSVLGSESPYPTLDEVAGRVMRLRHSGTLRSC